MFTIDTVYARALVVASQKEEVFRVLDFVGEQKAYCFERLLPAVHVVAKE